MWKTKNVGDDFVQSSAEKDVQRVADKNSYATVIRRKLHFDLCISTHSTLREH